MDNLETLSTLGNPDTGRRQAKHKNTTQKTEKKLATRTPRKTGGEPRCSRNISISVSYKTPVMLLIYRLKFDKSCVGNRGKGNKYT